MVRVSIPSRIGTDASCLSKATSWRTGEPIFCAIASGSSLEGATAETRFSSTLLPSGINNGDERLTVGLGMGLARGKRGPTPCVRPWLDPGRAVVGLGGRCIS